MFEVEYLAAARCGNGLKKDLRPTRDYVSTYRQLLMTRAASTRPRQLALNGGNGLAPISIEKPFAALFEAGADPEIPT
jgi:hypothetical protein